MKQRYRVILPVEIDGQVYGYGVVVELGLATAAEYAHALIAEKEETSDGRNG